MNNEELKLCNEFAAEKCDILFHQFGGTVYWKRKHEINPDRENWTQADHTWDITKPICREIVREHFKIQTNHMLSGRVICGAHPYGGEFIGESIAAAEIACINAIRLSEVE